MDIDKLFQDAFGTLLNYLPRLLGAFVVLLAGYLVARLLGALVARLLARTGFDRAMEHAGVTAFLRRSGTDLTPAGTLGKVVFWFAFIITFTMFASALGVPQISGFLNQMLGYIPRIFAAITILFFAAVLANFVAALIRGATGNEILARIGRYAIIVYASFAALTVLGIAVQLTANTLLIVLAGASLAFGIAFGWGGRDIARDLLHRAYSATTDRTATTGSAPPTSK
jgi:small-conductance mechanosensitive channel